ncbi:MAG: hypothetical protein FWD54_01325 [Endomicrobia bacterium]|nr:hypothetical protein [Endomicrobiia bacterium]MCL2798915.1 hypothetical protein [Endomicrobiia bacterium]
MLNKSKSSIDGFCECLGKFFLASMVVCSTVVLAVTACKRGKNNNEDYQERLRKAYEGLSPEEY